MKQESHISIKTVIVNTPQELKEQLDSLGDKAPIEKYSGFRPGTVDDPISAAKHTLRALARRWEFLNAQGEGSRRGYRQTHHLAVADVV